MADDCSHLDQVEILPIVRSVEPGEDWSWCYEDEVVMRLSAD